jgi:hypothetical protein
MSKSLVLPGAVVAVVVAAVEANKMQRLVVATIAFVFVALMVHLAVLADHQPENITPGETVAPKVEINNCGVVTVHLSRNEEPHLQQLEQTPKRATTHVDCDKVGVP